MMTWVLLDIEINNQTYAFEVALVAIGVSEGSEIGEESTGYFAQSKTLLYRFFS